MFKRILKIASALALGAMTLTGFGAVASNESGNTQVACTYHNSHSANVPCATCGVRG